MKCLIKVANTLMMAGAKSMLKRKRGHENYSKFKQMVSLYKERLYPFIPYLGKTVFDNSYYFANCYFFFFAALKDLGYSAEEAMRIIWKMNESVMRLMPAPVRILTGKYYANRSRKMGISATQKGKVNNLHPYDWKIEYESVSKNKWIFNVSECYILKMAKQFNMTEMFPHVCRMDYLFSHYFRQGFYRDKTLGDGDNICNCCWEIPGNCEWPLADNKLK